jgi:hypothetical protein
MTRVVCVSHLPPPLSLPSPFPPELVHCTRVWTLRWAPVVGWACAGPPPPHVRVYVFRVCVCACVRVCVRVWLPQVLNRCFAQLQMQVGWGEDAVAIARSLLHSLLVKVGNGAKRWQGTYDSPEWGQLLKVRVYACGVGVGVRVGACVRVWCMWLAVPGCMRSVMLSCSCARVS